MEKNSQVKVAAVIVSYNSADDLKTCIDAFGTAATSANIDSMVAVVDNASKDASCEVAKKAGATVIANGKNLGFAAAVNIGIKESFSNGATHILILNPDAIMTPDSLSPLLVGLAAGHKIGATGPAMFDNSGKPATAGYYLKAPSWISVLLFSTFLRPRFINHPYFVRRFYEETGLGETDRPVAQIPGACLLTSREVLEDVGLLDEDFAIWFEDVEWCYRARRKGYIMQYCHGSHVTHEGGVSFAKWQSLDKAVTFYVSMKTFFRKHKPLSYPLVIAAISFNSLVLAIKNGDRSNITFLKMFLTQKRGKLPQ